MTYNYTPHPITLCAEDGTPLTVFPSAGIARAAETLTVGGEWGDGFPCAVKTTGDLTGLPDQKPGVFYIVSAMCIAAVRKAGRTDCATISREVRDEQGRTIGCRAFSPILP